VRNRLRQGRSTCGRELQFLVRFPLRKRLHPGLRKGWSGMEKNRSQLRRLDFVAESQPATEGIGAAGSQTKPALRRLLAGRLRKHDLKHQQPRSPRDQKSV